VQRNRGVDTKEWGVGLMVPRDTGVRARLHW